ncbi:Hypothetical predicted protein [Olea europaea subsp. europaea]|uniref:Uncharacterized protein n=1 Tax=Olea europaea subsp. europaea TaxID=158383 RepID=A0A8S0UMC2_OLEEU|nr:Hypothetical predicted protein [Olea europaea subsp. europaea]
MGCLTMRYSSCGLQGHNKRYHSWICLKAIKNQLAHIMIERWMKRYTGSRQGTTSFDQ